jgi:hypothetical protein
MPTGKNWFHFIFIQIVFVVGISFVVILSFIKKIKANWPEYRCNPIYMPLSDNVELDFTYCVQSMQKQMMGNFLQPFSWILSNMAEMGGSFTDSINDSRNMFGNIRMFSTDIFQNIFGVFMNLVIEIQKITMGTKDLMQKIIGTIATLIFIIDGTLKTMSSTWNGPVGQLTRGVGKMASGSCFHPQTKVQLFNGTVKEMKDIDLGDILENGSRVKAVMKIDNTNHVSGEKLYKLEKRGVQGADIYVTGSHYVKDPTGTFIKVEKYSKAQLETDLQTDWFSCLVTDNHIIQIGKETFWDWDDYLLSK